MARYRQYKNGIFGHKYKQYYIIRGEKKGAFSIMDENKNVVADGLEDFDDCEWYIDKTTATEDEIKLMKSLYDKEIFQLSSTLMELMEKNGSEGLSDEEEELYELVGKVRKRKTKERAF